MPSSCPRGPIQDPRGHLTAASPWAPLDQVPQTSLVPRRMGGCPVGCPFAGSVSRVAAWWGVETTRERRRCHHIIPGRTPWLSPAVALATGQGHVARFPHRGVPLHLPFDAVPLPSPHSGVGSGTTSRVRGIYANFLALFSPALRRLLSSVRPRESVSHLEPPASAASRWPARSCAVTPHVCPIGPTPGLSLFWLT